MPKQRKIQRRPKSKNCYLVAANFLVNRVLPVAIINNTWEKNRVQCCQKWWTEIDAQLASVHAMVYVPDLCIAESFKVLAKKYYGDKYFARPVDYKKARKALGSFLHTSPRSLGDSKRTINVHDLSTSRDIIIAVDSFYKIFLKHKLDAGIVDLFILATAKYLMDFFNVSKSQLHIVTLDNALWKGSKRIADVPSAFNPNHASEYASKVFV